MATALDLNKVTDEQLEKDMKDLSAKTDITPEEKEKLSGLKEERNSRYQTKITKLHSEKLAEKNKREQLEKQLEEQKVKLEEIEKKEKAAAKPKIVEEFVELEGKKYYTDETLKSMVASGELEADKAYAHQQQRVKAEIEDNVYKRIKGEEKQNENKKTFEDDRKLVMDEYPQFNPRNPDHDPEDPLYKTASEIWVEGYQNNPRGLSLAIKRAKQILRMSDERPDVSNEHSVGRNRSSQEQVRGGEKEATLDATEQEAAGRMYMNIINPATGRNYTESEAIIKATKAKTARMKR